MNDLREWIETMDKVGELQRVKGASLDLEIGTITELWGANKPALLFTEIPGYPPGYGIVTQSLSSFRRISLTMGINQVTDKISLVRACKDKLKRISNISPNIQKSGPVMENVMENENVDLTRFPAPLWHEYDGGKWLGTGDLVITKDPEENWINLGTYRVQVQDKTHCTVFPVKGKHGDIMMQKYWREGKPCPIAVSLGHDPLLFLVAGMEVPWGVSEYDLAGGIKGKAIDTFISSNTGLLLPANAEIVLEGEIPPNKKVEEGPFGEWTGYYGGGISEKPLMTVKRIYYRSNPINLGAPPGVPPSDNTYFLSPLKSAGIWNELEAAGVPGIKGVWEMEEGGGRMLLVVAIQQLYPGHSKQAGHAAAQCHQGVYSNRFVVVVDEDIDPANLSEVTWATCTRVDLKHDVDVIERCWTSPLDTMSTKGFPKGGAFSTRAIIDACRPWERLEDFPRVACASKKLKEETLTKWKDLFDQLGK